MDVLYNIRSEIKEAIFEDLKELREEGKTDKEIAKAIGISQKSLKKFEEGEIIDFDTFLKIYEKHGTYVVHKYGDDIFTPHNEMSPRKNRKKHNLNRQDKETIRAKIKISFGDKDINVGEIAETHDNRVHFQYDQEILDLGLNLSPLELEFDKNTRSSMARRVCQFCGIPGVFSDSLPDRWGLGVAHKSLIVIGRFAGEVKRVEDLLKIVGTKYNRMGALKYEKPNGLDEDNQNAIDVSLKDISLDEYYQCSLEIRKYKYKETESIKSLIENVANVGGARPKMLMNFNEKMQQMKRHHMKTSNLQNLPKGFSPWIVKFPSLEDFTSEGAMEYVYSIMARNAGLNMPETHLFESQYSAGYFGVKRFDWDGQNRYHTHTMAGIAHRDFSEYDMPHLERMGIVAKVTNQDIDQIKEMFKITAFNILSGNEDDHLKNFSFIMDKKGHWNLSPAYDITFCYGSYKVIDSFLGTESPVNTVKDVMRLGKSCWFETDFIKETIEKTLDSLSDWTKLAKEHGVSNDIAEQIQYELNRRIVK